MIRVYFRGFTSFKNIPTTPSPMRSDIENMTGVCVLFFALLALVCVVDSFSVRKARFPGKFARNVVGGNEQNIWGGEIGELLGALNKSSQPQLGNYASLEALKIQLDSLKSNLGGTAPRVAPLQDEGGKVLPRIEIGKVDVLLASAASTPVLLVHGKGKVGQHALSIAQRHRAQMRTLQIGMLSAKTERELLPLLEGVKSIVIAANGVITIEKGLFGGTKETLSDPEIDRTTLQKLLNAAKLVMERSDTDMPIKVVLLGRACKPPRSAASMLLGDHTDIESECILLCKQRGLAHNIVKVGKIVDTNCTIPDEQRRRHMETALLPVLTTSASTQEAANPVPRNPVVITLKSGIEHTECTYTTAAAEALFRAAAHPDQNATFSILSDPLLHDRSTSSALHSGGGATVPSEDDWADAFLKIVGPELLRLPLRFASPVLALQCVHSLGLSIAATQSVRVNSLSGVGTVRDLVTPVMVEACDNGVRLTFQPARGGAYKSSREDKAEQVAEDKKRTPTAGSAVTAPDTSKSAPTYTQPGDSNNSNIPGRSSAPKNSQEGGLEVVVEETPYPRVRVRRCGYGPGAVVKVESEGSLLQAVQRALLLLEMECQLVT